MISALDRKLLRDLWRLRGQVVSIALVIASGVALLVMSLSAHEALGETAAAYYERYRFGDVFATVKRAPLNLKSRIAAIEGVQTVQTRISQQAILDIEGFREPVLGRVMSLPERTQPILNQLAIRSGRLIEPGRTDEVVINESFAEAHGLELGDTIGAIINANRRQLQVVGTAMSPEFIYVLSPFALIPDKERYGILWMGRKALEAAYDYEGAFNDLSVATLRGADTRQIVEELDNILAPYGSVGAVDRGDHLSSWFVANELDQLRTSARLFPTVFLLVAAFLTNMVLNRLISTERSEIGLMKAFGYTSLQIGTHYAKLVMLMSTLGVALGWIGGAELGRLNTVVYAETLNFPILIYRPGPTSFVISAIVSFGVGLAASARAVRSAATLPPIVAMSPPAPPSFHRSQRALGDLGPLLDQPTRIILRQIGRWPGRAATTSLGFALAIGMMVVSLQFTDAVDHLARTYFDESQREDLALGFVESQAATILHEVGRLPGVLSVEPMRVVAADLSSRHVTHRGALQGLPQQPRLTRIFDPERGAQPVPKEGVALAKKLAEKLRVEVGDEIWVHMLEGQRFNRRLTVADTFDSYIGMSAFVDLDTLNRLLGERPSVEYAKVIFDESRETELLAELKMLPTVSTAALKSAAVENFHETIAETMLIFVTFFSIFSFGLGFGVTYNAQRIAMSERGRELATLRVLGFTRQESFYILFGETMLLALLSLPVGCVIGFGLAALFTNAEGYDTELMRLPLAIEPSTFGVSILVLLIAAVVAGIFMKTRTNRLDLISVLKTRE